MSNQQPPTKDTKSACEEILDELTGENCTCSPEKSCPSCEMKKKILVSNVSPEFFWGDPMSKKKPQRLDFTVNLDEIPGGNRKPHELCDFLEKMRDWRARSANSQILIN